MSDRASLEEIIAESTDEQLEEAGELANRRVRWWFTLSGAMSVLALFFSWKFVLLSLGCVAMTMLNGWVGGKISAEVRKRKSA